MENETEKLIQEQLTKLPARLRGAIEATPWKPLVQEIGKENGLDPEQLSSLEQETMLIIYAFEPPESFVENIKNEAGVTEETALILAESIAEKIFDPILKKVGELRKEGSMPEKQSGGLPEIPPEDLPAIVQNEKVHEVVNPLTTNNPEQQANIADNFQPPTNPEPQKVAEKRPEISQKPSSYPSGQDPYREPLG